MVGPVNYNLESHDKGLIGNGLSYINGFSTKVKTGLLIGIAAGGIAAGTILAGGGPSGSNDNVPFVNPTPTLETYVTATPLATNTPTPEPTSTPDLNALAYSAGKGSPEQAAQAYKDIMSYYDSTQDSERARAQLERLVIGMVDSELGYFNVDKLTELDIVCIERERGPVSEESRNRIKLETAEFVEQNKNEPIHFYIQPSVRRWERCLY